MFDFEFFRIVNWLVCLELVFVEFSDVCRDCFWFIFFLVYDMIKFVISRKVVDEFVFLDLFELVIGNFV